MRAWQTPHGARPNREEVPPPLQGLHDAWRLCREMAAGRFCSDGGRVPARCAKPPGRSLEPRSNARPRGMIVLPATADRIRLTGPAAIHSYFQVLSKPTKTCCDAGWTQLASASGSADFRRCRMTLPVHSRSEFCYHGGLMRWLCPNL